MEQVPPPAAHDPGPPTPASVERARQSFAAGGPVEHAVVACWLRTWGRPGRLPFAEWLAADHG